MVERIVIIFLFTFLIMACLLLVTDQFSNATLRDPVKIEENEKNFTLHTRVEQDGKDLRVLRSLEYTGEETVMMEHSTPLISVSLDKNKHSFTGSPVEREMDTGDYYHIPQPLGLENVPKGTHHLYIKAVFLADNKEVKIETNCTIELN